MLPGGQMVSTGRGGGYSRYGAVGTMLGGQGINGQWVKGFDRQRFIGNDLQMLRAERRWGRTRAAGRWVGGLASRYSGTVAKGGTQALGAAGMLGMIPRYGGEAQDMGANMAMMSGNPYAMAAGAGYKFTGWKNSLKTGNKWLDTANKYANPVTALNSLVFDQISGGGNTKLGAFLAKKNGAAMQQMRAKMVSASMGEGTAATDSLFGLVGGEQEGGKWTLGGEAAGLRQRYGRAGLVGLQSRFTGQAAARRRKLIAEMQGKIDPKGPGGTYTEEQIRGQDKLYSKLMDFAAQLGMVLKDMPKRINVTAKVPGGSNPGGRVEGNSGYGGTGETPEYRPEDAR